MNEKIKRKLSKIFILIGLFISLVNLTYSIDLKNYNGTFFDGFESGSFATNGWIVQNGSWAVNTGNVYAGTYKAEALGNMYHELYLNISTENYANISLRYYYSTGGTTILGRYIAQWWNGTNWVTVMNITTQAGYALASFNLTSAANDRPDFRIRYICDPRQGNRPCRLDNVSITGVILDAVPPTVSSLFPIAGRNYTINSTVEIAANVSDASGISKVFANITYPNGSSTLLQLNNVSSTKYNASFTDLTQFGRYNVTIIANDTKNNVNNTEKTYFNRIHTIQNTTFDVIDENNQTINFTQTVLQNNSGLLTVRLNFSDHVVHNIIIYNFNETQPFSLIRLAKNTSDMYRLNNTFAIDMSKVAFTNATLTLNATGNTLYKCINYTFETLTCNDDGYEFVKYLTPGTTYNITINSTDPGFGDASPDLGTPDDGSFNPYNDGFSGTSNTYTATQADDNVNFGVRQVNGPAANLDLNAYLNLSYNLTNLTNQGVTPNKIINFTFRLSHCFVTDNVGAVTCGTAPGGTIEANAPVYLYNWTSGQYVQVGTFNGSSTTEGIANLTVTSGFNDFINPTTGFVNIRWKLNVTITVNGNDAAFAADYAPLIVSYDTTKPNVSLLSPQPNSIFNTSNIVTLAINATDDSGISTAIANITLSNGTVQQINLIRNSTSNMYNNTFVVPNLLGLYNVTFIVNDAYNNVNDSIKTNFTVYDYEKPSVFDVRPISGAIYNTSNTITISANATDNIGISSVYANLTLPNSTVQQIFLIKDGATDKYNNTFTIPELVGQYNITFIANDTSNNINLTTKTLFFSEDNSPPSIEIISPINKTYNYTNVLVNISAQDNIAVDRIWFNWNGTDVNYSAPMVVNFTDNSMHTLYAYTNDTSGNSNWTYVSFYIDVCIPNMTNTSWSEWADVGCYLDQMNQSRYFIEYDLNYCGEVENNTHYENRLVGPNLMNTSWTDWYNITNCMPEDYYTQERNITQYDTYGCAANVTFFDYKNESCDYCTPNMTYTDWTAWMNLTCAGDYMNQSRSRIYYDQNYCGEVDNVTEYDYRLVGPELYNVTGDWHNITDCMPGDYYTQERNITEKDAYSCKADYIYYEYRNLSCSYDTLNPSVEIITPPNNAVDPDEIVYVICSANDNYKLSNISLKINGLLNQTQLTNATSYVAEFTPLYLENGDYNISCVAYDSSGNGNESTISIKTNHTLATIYSLYNGNTTNWDAVPDITNVCNGTAILDNNETGMIQWNGCVNAAGVNFDVAVNLAYNNVTVTFGLHSSFNSSAKITMRNLPWNETPEILMDGILCPIDVCQNITYDNETKVLVFDVTHFTSYTTQGATRLEIWDETDIGMPWADQIRYPGNNTYFFANYTKNSNPLPGGICTINFNDLSASMTYNSTKTVFEYNRTFATNGTFYWNVTCSATGAQTLTTNDTVFISPMIIDTSAPIITNVNVSGITNQSAVINWTTDDISNTSVNYGTTLALETKSEINDAVTQHSITLTNLINNTLYYYNVTSCNIYNNCSTSGPYNFTTEQNPPYIDTENPSVSTITPTNADEDEEVTYSAIVSDNVGVVSCNLYINGTLNGSMNIVKKTANRTVTITEPGIYSFLANCSDAAGNYNDTSITIVTINDVTEPSVNIISPIATTYNYTEILVNITATDNVAVDSIWFNWNGTDVNYTEPILINFTDNSTITLYAYVNDSSNNIGEKNVTFTVNTSYGGDFTPPNIFGVTNGTITNESAVIIWFTDQAANSTVQYGTDTSLGSYSYNETFDTNHYVLLTNLEANTTYYYNVTSCNIYNNCKTSGIYIFKTKENIMPDITPPTISNIQITSITTNSAHIKWITDENANGTVKYGTTLALINIASSATFTTSKDIVLSGLINGTTYYYNITACDIFGNCNTVGPRNFTTSQTITQTTGGGRGQVIRTCIEGWVCGAWTPCSPNGLSTRECHDVNECGTAFYRPIQHRYCTPEEIIKQNVTKNVTENITREVPVEERVALPSIKEPSVEEIKKKLKMFDVIRQAIYIFSISFFILIALVIITRQIYFAIPKNAADHFRRDLAKYISSRKKFGNQLNLLKKAEKALKKEEKKVMKEEIKAKKSKQINKLEGLKKYEQDIKKLEQKVEAKENKIEQKLQEEKISIEEEIEKMINRERKLVNKIDNKIDRFEHIKAEPTEIKKEIKKLENEKDKIEKYKKIENKIIKDKPVVEVKDVKKKKILNKLKEAYNI